MGPGGQTAVKWVAGTFLCLCHWEKIEIRAEAPIFSFYDFNSMNSVLCGLTLAGTGGGFFSSLQRFSQAGCFLACGILGLCVGAWADRTQAARVCFPHYPPVFFKRRCKGCGTFQFRPYSLRVVQWPPCHTHSCLQTGTLRCRGTS